MSQRRVQQLSIERRAIVAIACYFLLTQAFLAGLASGFAAGDMRASLGGTAAFICHGAGGTPEPSENNDNPQKLLCGLCALASAGPTLLPDAVDFAPVVLAFTPFVAPSNPGPEPETFDPRAGWSRAPPVFV